MSHTERGIELLIICFVAFIVLSNLMGIKITAIGRVEFSVALLAFPFTFLITDIITEIKGKSYAQRVVRHACVALLLVLLFQLLFVALPFAERSFVQQEYTAVFGSSTRILAASLVAFAFSQFHDVWAFDFWRQLTKGRFLWIRNNLSTIISQAIDTLIFMHLAFLYIPFLPAFINTSPTFTSAYVIQLALPYYGLKVVMALLDTPLIYLGRRLLRVKNS